MQVKLLPVRFGFTPPEDLQSRHLRFYEQLAGFAFGDADDGGVALDVGKTVPIASERSVSAASVAKAILDAHGRYSATRILLDLDGLDAKNVSRPDELIGATTAITKIVDGGPDRIVVVLLPYPLDDGDLASPGLLRLAGSHSVRIVSCDGTLYGAFFGDRSGKKNTEIAGWAKVAGTKPLDGLEAKLIRRIGQYRLPDSTAVVRHLHDGSRAFDEIYELAREKIAGHLKQGGTRRIAYDVRHSSWFRGPVEAALRDANVEEGALSVAGDASQASWKDVGLLMVPIVRTGASLGSMLATIAESGPMPRVWSLLSTVGREEREGRRDVTFTGKQRRKRKVQVRYALKVSGAEAAPDQLFWAHSDLPTIAFDESSEAGRLTSDEMWGMIFEVGLELESPVPSYRESIGYVPRFGQIAKRNGPFIAAKFEALLKETFPQDLPPSIGFLCPNEANASVLADSLRALAGHDTILVERALIDSLASSDCRLSKAAKSALTKVKEPLEAWRKLAAQASSSERPQVVLLDEFDLSGRTFEGLYALARRFELPVLCAMSLGSYASANARAELEVKRLALYEMGMAHASR